MRPFPTLLFLIALAAAGCASPSPEEEVRAHDLPAPPPLDERIAGFLPEGVTLETAERGAEYFSRTCAVCHGPDGSGTQLAPPLVGQAWTRVEPAAGPLAELIRTGIPKPDEYGVPMPARGGGGFSDEQIAAVAAYVIALHRSAPAAPRAPPRE